MATVFPISPATLKATAVSPSAGMQGGIQRNERTQNQATARRKHPQEKKENYLSKRRCATESSRSKYWSAANCAAVHSSVVLVHGRGTSDRFKCMHHTTRSTKTCQRASTTRHGLCRYQLRSSLNLKSPSLLSTRARVFQERTLDLLWKLSQLNSNSSAVQHANSSQLSVGRLPRSSSLTSLLFLPLQPFQAATAVGTKYPIFPRLPLPIPLFCAPLLEACQPVRSTITMYNLPSREAP